MFLKFNMEDLIWIPCIKIKEKEGSTLVQPIDGWEEHQIWTSNGRQFSKRALKRAGVELKKVKK